MLKEVWEARRVSAEWKEIGALEGQDVPIKPHRDSALQRPEMTCQAHHDSLWWTWTSKQKEA
jgi:hypothetical protein